MAEARVKNVSGDDRVIAANGMVVEAGKTSDPIPTDLAHSLGEQEGVWEYVKDPARVRAARKAAETRAAHEEADEAAADEAPEPGEEGEPA